MPRRLRYFSIESDAPLCVFDARTSSSATLYVAGVIHPDVIVDSDSSVLSVGSDLIPCALCPNDAQIEKLQAMSASDLDSAISTKEKEITAAESNFKVRLRMRRPTPLPPFKCKARKLLELRALEATELSLIHI